MANAQELQGSRGFGDPAPGHALHRPGSPGSTVPGDARLHHVYDEARPWTTTIEVQGFHWGGLTAGDWKTVFWILLAPFALANVAGWTIKAQRAMGSGAGPVAALSLTALLVSQAVTALVLIPYLWFQQAVRLGERGSAQVTAIVLFAITIGLFLLLVRTSAQSHFKKLTPQDQFRLLLIPEDRCDAAPGPRGNPRDGSARGQWDDPAGTVVTDPAIWGTHSILHRLRRLHLAIGLDGRRRWRLRCGRTTSGSSGRCIVVFGLVVVSTFATSFWPRNRALLWVTAVSSLTSLGLAVGSLVAIGISSAAGVRTEDLHTLTFGMTVVLGVSSMASVLQRRLADCGGAGHRLTVRSRARNRGRV